VPSIAGHSPRSETLNDIESLVRRVAEAAAAGLDPGDGVAVSALARRIDAELNNHNILVNRAYSISELEPPRGPVKRGKIYKEIAAGNLRARKCGRRTFVLGSDYLEWLDAAPILRPAAAPSQPDNRHAAPLRRNRGRPIKERATEISSDNAAAKPFATRTAERLSVVGGGE
jgi:hypothetical protein